MTDSRYQLHMKDSVQKFKIVFSYITDILELIFRWDDMQSFF